MSRHELTDEQWEVLGPLVEQPRKRTGRPPVDDRRVLNGVLYVLNTGCAWMDMPKEYGKSVGALLVDLDAVDEALGE